MDRPPIELRILGSTELNVAGERTGSFVLRQPKRLAVLAYLALATAGGYRRRDQMVALFWPELDQAHARNQLRKVLHALRSTLGVEAFVSRGEEELRLDSSRAWCDAVAFACFMREERWADALELYRGDLLEGFFPGGVGEQFETWLGDQRSTLREQAARAAWECSSRADLAGKRAEAVALARRAMELDPDNEDGVRRLISVLDRYGDRASALRLFQDWQSRLQAEYGAEPAPETRKLALKVKAPRKGESHETPHPLSSEPSNIPTGAPLPDPSPPSRSTEPSRRHGRRALWGFAAALALSVTIAALYASRTNAGQDSASGGGVNRRQATLAVLPLRGLGDSSDVRVGQAFAEELTTALAQVPTISLRSASRSRAAADAGGDLAAIGRLLGAGLVLDGGVQHGAHRWRITLRLVRVADEVTVWARAFDLEAHDMIAEQERVAKATVEELRAWLQEREE